MMLVKFFKAMVFDVLDKAKTLKAPQKATLTFNYTPVTWEQQKRNRPWIEFKVYRGPHSKSSFLLKFLVFITLDEYQNLLLATVGFCVKYRKSGPRALNSSYKTRSTVIPFSIDNQHFAFLAKTKPIYVHFMSRAVVSWIIRAHRLILFRAGCMDVLNSVQIEPAFII
ncbi:hypothetical protein NQ315_003799 [Exocentrus adspersus]|uniref:Uncharacterized protein n=1 Tax=Exocentrus adspersus TaxID=1586481 RepID=A0AAV8VDD6_9CUCU|nr:hypothetical protein NQ315_003799 [Exocentrus adspersus]